MSKLEKLTPEQEALIPVIRDKWINRLFSLPKINEEKATEFVNLVYEISKLKKPKVIIMDSPLAAQKYVQLCTGKKDYEPFSNYGNIGDYGWVAFYDFFRQIGTLKNDTYNQYADLLYESAIFDMLVFENACIVVKMPVHIRRNADGRMHSSTEMAIKWEDGTGFYFINGRHVLDNYFLMAQQGKVTKDTWLSESNEDVKAAWFEIIGSEGVMKVLGAEQVDSNMTVHANGELEEHVLYKTPFILPEIGEKLAWVKYICPSTGSTYLISCNPKWDNVKDAVLDQCPFGGEEIKTYDDYSFTSRS